MEKVVIDLRVTRYLNKYNERGLSIAKKKRNNTGIVKVLPSKRESERYRTNFTFCKNLNT